MGFTNADIMSDIAKGWAPNLYLTNMSMAYFDEGQYAARELFPVIPVSLPSSYYYQWLKGDLARRGFKNKPQFGRVAPGKFGWKDDVYACRAKQIIVGADQLEVRPFQVTNQPLDPRAARARYVADQVNLELDAQFAENYFKAGVWTNQLTGKSATPGTNEFLQFDNANSDPLKVLRDAIKGIQKNSRRAPNKLGLGYDVFEVLQDHPDIVDRVKYGGTTANPAQVTCNVLAQLLQLEKVVVFSATYNKAQEGVTDDMDFICDSKGALLVYAPNAPAIDEPSAGYTFAWDFVGNGQWIAMDQYEGERGTHSDYHEGLMSTDMKITAQDCATYLTACVA